MIKNLNDKDIDFLYDQISTYADVEGHYREVTATPQYLLRFWESNKRKFYNIFNKNFILEKEVEFTKPTEQLEDEMGEAISGDRFCYDYRDWIRQNFSTKEEEYYTFMNLVHFDDLVKNFSPNEKRIVAITKSDEIIRLDAHCKIMRFLKKMNDNYIHSEFFEAFRLKHSMVLNDRKIKGRLCLSIHPCDFITMSDNEYHWESCMSWSQNGDYRAGTVEMMNSPYVVEAYLQGDASYYYWLNKKWRELFIVHPNIIAGIKAYPYANETLETECLKWLRELVTDKEGFGAYEESIVNVTSGLKVPDTEISFNIYPSGHMYNDFYGKHNAILAKNLPAGGYTVDYGGTFNCMICGEEEPYSVSGGFLTCLECIDYFYCDYCEGYHSGSSYTIGDDVYCEECYNERVVVCDCCEESVDIDDTVYVEAYINGEKSGKNWTLCICENCLNSSTFKQTFGEPIKLTYNFYRIDVENFSKEGCDIFGCNFYDFDIEPEESF
jgi:hypothetical protein